MPIINTSHARYELWYHLVFCTKYRKKAFNREDTKGTVRKVIREIALEYDGEVGEIEVMSDHLHCMVRVPPKIALSRMVSIIKSLSTRRLLEGCKWLKEYYWSGRIWAGGYFIRSVGPGLTKEMIEEYIKGQTEA